MNVVFRLPTPELEEDFVKEAEEARAWSASRDTARVGGIRASIYNAVDLEWVEGARRFHEEFAKRRADSSRAKSRRSSRERGHFFIFEPSTT